MGGQLEQFRPVGTAALTSEKDNRNSYIMTYYECFQSQWTEPHRLYKRLVLWALGPQKLRTVHRKLLPETWLRPDGTNSVLYMYMLRMYAYQIQKYENHSKLISSVDYGRIMIKFSTLEEEVKFSRTARSLFLVRVVLFVLGIAVCAVSLLSIAWNCILI